MATRPYKEYLTHDNGGPAFLVRYDRTTFWVYKQGNNEDVPELPDDPSQARLTRWIKSLFRELVMTSPYSGVFVGKSGGIDHCRVETGRHYVGNSMLFVQPDGRCVCVSSNVTAFVPPEPIVDFKSPVIGSDVSYPYAIGVGASYLFGEGCFVPHSDLSHPREFPYAVAYMHDRYSDGDSDDGFDDRAYIDAHKIQGFEELEARPW